jgi:excisionase family DNA binding protein
MSGFLAKALLDDLDDQALDELARLLEPRLARPRAVLPVRELPSRPMTVAQVAQRLALSTKAVRALIKRGELPAVKVSGRLRVEAEDLAAFLAGQRVEHGAAPPVRSARPRQGRGALRELIVRRPDPTGGER